MWPLQSGPICEAQGREGSQASTAQRGTYCWGHSSDVASPCFIWGNIRKQGTKGTFSELEPPGCVVPEVSPNIDNSKHPDISIVDTPYVHGSALMDTIL